MYKDNKKLNKNVKGKRRQYEETPCDELVIAYYDTPCGMFDLKNCPFDCENCDDCEKLLKEGESE